MIYPFSLSLVFCCKNLKKKNLKYFYFFIFKYSVTVWRGYRGGARGVPMNIGERIRRLRDSKGIKRSWLTKKTALLRIFKW